MPHVVVLHVVLDHGLGHGACVDAFPEKREEQLFLFFVGVGAVFSEHAVIAKKRAAHAVIDVLGRQRRG